MCCESSESERTFHSFLYSAESLGKGQNQQTQQCVDRDRSWYKYQAEARSRQMVDKEISNTDRVTNDMAVTGINT